MAAESGQSDPVVTPKTNQVTGTPLEVALRKRPWDFQFYQAVRLLERFSGGAPVGLFAHPHEEAVRFGGNPRLAFPASEINGFEPRDGAPPKLAVNFMGLTGFMGILPSPYSELQIERSRAGDHTIRDFFDVFTHRSVSLLYRAWLKYRFWAAYERGGRDSLTPPLLCLIGMGTEGLQNRQPVTDQTLLYYAGLLAQFPRSMGAAKQLLSDYFDVPVEVLPFAGAWRRIDRGSRTCFLDGDSKNEQLGVGTVVGDEVWDQQSVVRFRIGPLKLSQYKEFLPGGAAHPALRALTRFFCGEDLDVEVQLVLRREEAPPLGIDTDAGPPLLGWVSWLFSRPLSRDPDETILRLWEM